MTNERKPSGQLVPLEQAINMIQMLEEKMPEFTLPAGARTLNDGKEFCKAFIDSGATFIDRCYGMNDRGEPCPVTLFLDDEMTPVAAWNVDRLCPPFCEDD